MAQTWRGGRGTAEARAGVSTGPRLPGVASNTSRTEPAPEPWEEAGPVGLALTFSPNSAMDSWGAVGSHLLWCSVWVAPGCRWPVLLGLRKEWASRRACVCWWGPGCKERPEKHGLGEPTRRKGPCGPQLSRVCLRDSICPLSLQPSGAGLPGPSSATVGSLADLARGLSLQPHGGPQPRVLCLAPRLLAPQSSWGGLEPGSHCACSPPP